MIDERHEELAALYAFDLLEGAERSAFEGELNHQPALRELVAELRATADTLAYLPVTDGPSPSLKQRILHSVTHPTTPTARPGYGLGHLIPFSLPTWVPWAAAAVLALTAATFARLYVGERMELASLRESEALARVDLQGLRNQFEAERILLREQIARLERESSLDQLKIASLASLAPDSPEARAIAVWSPEKQQGVLTAASLPPLPADKSYQLWVIDPQYPIPVDGGVFSVEPGSGGTRYQFRCDKPIAQVAKFAVSLERKGGVPKAEGPMVLISP